ncbi:hypothetical protein ACFWHT_10995 [Microbacterium sp. NPDC058342]|uniref:hypothetical protein n=1 Tax=Microbacterium sp. NPDC058342 TaxID=3346454 RepID=UPI0036522FB4
MTQQDILFMAMAGIGLASLTLVVIQLLKPRRRDNRGEWYEGPWDDDDRPRGSRG